MNSIADVVVGASCCGPSGAEHRCVTGTAGDIYWKSAFDLAAAGNKD